MKNILARGGTEFLAVLLGISGSLWVDDYRIELVNNEKTIYTLKSLKKELESAYDYGQDIFQNISEDVEAHNYIIDHWGKINIDTLISLKLGRKDINGETDLILTLKAYRGFHPPRAIYNSLNNDGSIGLIDDLELKRKINDVFQIRSKYLDEGSENQRYIYRRFNEYIIVNHPALQNKNIKDKQKELTEFLRDKVVYGFIIEQKNLNDFISQVIEWNLEAIDDLINSIDNYLKKA
ncbi:MAG: hypothetical protein HOE72_05305 [Candidatus Marinimicrobia bacterium]|jgi:hypothetical protein|nr:hypothetical protein [Candidatus Neomarinimicrobiota bacterium]|tara:strand:+ start:709 stop:1416 length:708 start_codon:yes stop_codon:yes gene_type:complete